ncbi:MAG: DsrE/DsrF/TusD sulfur relay family protein [Candidatus Heimdallarchaeota archaeon]
MKITLILNDAPYGSERTYNSLRLAIHLQKREGTLVRVFLLGDAITSASKNQKTAEGYYNIGRMIKTIVRNGEVKVCGTCMDARGFATEMLLEGTRRSTMDELTDWVIESDKTLVF